MNPAMVARVMRVANGRPLINSDAVLVVEPTRILVDGPRGAAELYVALTRASQRLGVLHQGPLPQALTGLADLGSTAPVGSRRSR